MRAPTLAWIAPVGMLLVPTAAFAHCPLCMAGAGGAAIVASYLGLGSTSIGIFIGAFAVAIGLWSARMVRKRGLRIPPNALAAVSFLTTVFPLKPLLSEYTSFYVSLAGDYGSWLNRTYLINLFVAGSVVGAAIMLAAPSMSRRLTAVRKGASFPYQGIVVSFAALAASAAVAQILAMV